MVNDDGRWLRKSECFVKSLCFSGQVEFTGPTDVEPAELVDHQRFQRWGSYCRKLFTSSGWLMMASDGWLWVIFNNGWFWWIMVLISPSTKRFLPRLMASKILLMRFWWMMASKRSLPLNHTVANFPVAFFQGAVLCPDGREVRVYCYDVQHTGGPSGKSTWRLLCVAVAPELQGSKL